MQITIEVDACEFRQIASMFKLKDDKRAVETINEISRLVQEEINNKSPRKPCAPTPVKP